MLSFLKEVLSQKEIEELREVLDFSLDPKIELEGLQEKIALANFFQAKLIKLIYKLRLMESDLEVAYEQWYATEIHNVAIEYDGIPELFKTHKDYEREIKKHPEYAEYKLLLDKIAISIKTLEMKEKELSSFDWKVKGIIDIHKIKHNLMY